MSADDFADTVNGSLLAEVARGGRMIFFTGLPASGKSFLLRETVSIAAAAGRRVQMIRWDTGLASFQNAAVSAKYPDVGYGSHPVVRKAAGLWGRRAVARWAAEHPDPADMLIGEVPIIGNRYSEFVKRLPDDAEAALASDATTFLYPVPTPDVRARLEAVRRDTFANPRHPDEARDAPPSTMELAWRLTCSKAIDLGLIRDRDLDSQHAYEERVYCMLFDRLLQRRNARALRVETLWPGGGSAHDLRDGVRELTATPDEVSAAIAAVEAAMTPEQAALDIENWHRP